MNPAHRLNRSRHCLNFTPANIAAGDYARAARALCRSVSHAATAAAVHWHHRRDTRRRLRLFVKAPVFDGSVPLPAVGALQSQGCRSCRSWIPAFAGTGNNQTT